MKDYNYIQTLNDNDSILVKTTLLIYIYNYYKNNNLLDDNLRSIFDKILVLIKEDKLHPGIFEPQYFKLDIKDIKTILSKAPYDMYSNASFKEENNSKKH